MTDRPLGAQISHMLKDRGVDVIFGIPGVHNQEMYRGIEEAGLTHVLARHEQGAGSMADGYARATGKPGVAYVITGPGLCNIMTPMGQAYSDSVPVLVLSSCLDEVAATRGQLHQMKDQTGAAATVCDWSHTARTADAAYTLIDRALVEFQTARPRTKHISVPIASLEGLAPQPPVKTAKPEQMLQLDGVVMDQIEERLQSAQRPLFIIGGGGANGGDLSRLSRRAGAMVMTTYAGRGALDGTDARCLGACLARPSSADVIAQADLVVVVGSELSEVDLWRDNLGHTADMIRVDIDPEVLVDRHRAEIPIHASAQGFYNDMSNRLDGWADDKPLVWNLDKLKTQVDTWRAEVTAERPGIIPVVDALHAVLPKNTTIFSDMTQFAYAAKEVFPMSAPNLWHHPYGFGTLGYALPAAIGGKIGVGDKPVIAIAGDYGFQYSLQELMVAVELDLTLPIIIWDNGKLGEIEDSMIRAQIAPNAVIQKNPDFLKLAEAYGCATAAPKSLEAFKSAVTTALSAQGPTVIHVTSDIAQTP